MGTQGNLDTLILSLKQAHIDTRLAAADQHLSDTRLSEIFVGKRTAAYPSFLIDSHS